MRRRDLMIGLLSLPPAAVLPGLAQAQGKEDKVEDMNAIIRSLAPIKYLPEHSGRKEPSIDLRIGFDYNKATLREEALPQLTELAKALGSKQLSDVRIRIVGHTDAKSSSAYNLKLSMARAESVAKHLIDNHGIMAGRLELEGRGESQLKDRLQPHAGINRRVEIVALRPDGTAVQKDGQTKIKW